MTEIDKIYQKFLKGECSQHEATQLLDYFRTGTGDAEMVRLIGAELEKAIYPEDLLPPPDFSATKNLNNLMQLIQPVKMPQRSFAKYGYAAALLIFGVAFGFYFLTVRPDKSGSPLRSEKLVQITDIAPGHNQATLTLADGRTISLDSAQNGIIVNDKDIKYEDGTTIEAPTHHSSSITYHSLTTPKGGQYQVVLPEGTKVWLNAASTLKYPSRFANDCREVEITGEGYFAVNAVPGTGNDKVPFIVRSNGQETRVLGTEFNITAYPEEDMVSTTLVKGAVSVLDKKSGASLRLVPNEQSIFTSSGSFTKQSTDPAVAVAWKSGMFCFKKIPFQEMMRQLERWYDVEVIYRGGIPQESFSGTMKRSVSLSTVLEFLKESEIAFTIESRRLIID